jgi:hypothetical protein
VRLALVLLALSACQTQFVQDALKPAAQRCEEAKAAYEPLTGSRVEMAGYTALAVAACVR